MRQKTSSRMCMRRSHSIKRILSRLHQPKITMQTKRPHTRSRVSNLTTSLGNQVCTNYLNEIKKTAVIPPPPTLRSSRLQKSKIQLRTKPSPNTTTLSANHKSFQWSKIRFSSHLRNQRPTNSKSESFHRPSRLEVENQARGLSSQVTPKNAICQPALPDPKSKNNCQTITPHPSEHLHHLTSKDLNRLNINFSRNKISILVCCLSNPQLCRAVIYLRTLMNWENDLQSKICNHVNFYLKSVRCESVWLSRSPSISNNQQKIKMIKFLWELPPATRKSSRPFRTDPN